MLNGITPITFTENKLGDYQIREVGINGEYGKLLFYFSDFSSIPKTIQLSQKGYFTDLTFEKGTSDKLKSLAIFNENSTFNISSSYLSIQNSNIQENAIGFLGDFKNISLFSEGQSVGESTIPYGSELLINIGDPILKRKTPKNHTIS
ncbi:hypothetical protein IJM86_01130 [bacterium]|nr:hypothetical protein [bacterium]